MGVDVDVRDSPPRAVPLHLTHPPWLQFLVPLGVPLYPVDKIRLDRTRRAPTLRFMQFERWDARDASVWIGSSVRASWGGAGSGDSRPRNAPSRRRFKPEAARKAAFHEYET